MGRELHCWEDGPDFRSTCMLLDGHEGDHEYTPDNSIVVAFKDEHSDEAV